MKCNNCGFEFDKTYQRTCPLCGAPLNIGQEKRETTPLTDEVRPIEKEHPEETSIICPNCNKPIPVNTKFCPECGFDLRIKNTDAQQTKEEIEARQEGDIETNINISPSPTPQTSASQQSKVHSQTEETPDLVQNPIEDSIAQPEKKDSPAQDSIQDTIKDNVAHDGIRIHGETSTSDIDSPPNGEYIPYAGEEDSEIEEPDEATDRGLSSTIIGIIVFIVSLIIGGLLYYFIDSAKN